MSLLCRISDYTPDRSRRVFICKDAGIRKNISQAENEMSAVYMIFGAYACGMRSMTSSSGPGFSLKQEGIGYLCANNLPAVLVNVQRWGPGLGSLDSSQTDYLRDTRGGGNGDYRVIVLAPNSIQETIDLMYNAWDLAEKYRNPVEILSEGSLGQMMEAVEFRNLKQEKKTWDGPGMEQGEIIRNWKVLQNRQLPKPKSH